jgi:hypothetical protein
VTVQLRQSEDEPWRDYVAEPTDPTGRRREFRVPDDPNAADWLPAGAYDIRVLANTATDQREWEPVHRQTTDELQIELEDTPVRPSSPAPAIA